MLSPNLSAYLVKIVINKRVIHPSHLPLVCDSCSKLFEHDTEGRYTVYLLVELGMLWGFLCDECRKRYHPNAPFVSDRRYLFVVADVISTPA